MSVVPGFAGELRSWIGAAFYVDISLDDMIHVLVVEQSPTMIVAEIVVEDDNHYFLRFDKQCDEWIVMMGANKQTPTFQYFTHSSGFSLNGWFTKSQHFDGKCPIEERTIPDEAAAEFFSAIERTIGMRGISVEITENAREIIKSV